MILYLIYINVFTDKTIKTAGSINEPVAMKHQEPSVVNGPSVSQGPSVVHGPSVANGPSEVSNQLPEVFDASVHNGSSVFNPNSIGILPQNQDIFEKQANFGSDVTNIKQFYQNNPEVFSKILGTNTVTNVADWERKSKEMFQSVQQNSSGPIQAANFEDNFAPL
jgi:hypothetical protein